MNPCALLRAAGLDFTVQPAPVDEAALKEAARAEGIPPADTALLLAEGELPPELLHQARDLLLARLTEEEGACG